MFEDKEKIMREDAYRNIWKWCTEQKICADKNNEEEYEDLYYVYYADYKGTLAIHDVDKFKQVWLRCRNLPVFHNYKEARRAMESIPGEYYKYFWKRPRGYFNIKYADNLFGEGVCPIT